MGGFALTKPGLIDMTATTDPSTGQEMYVPQAPTFFSNLVARQRALLAGENSALDDSLSNFGDIHNVPSAVPNAALPRTVDPSFTQVTHDQFTGLPTQINPAETKLGKLIHIITAAASGAASAIGTQNPQAGMEAARTQQTLPLQRIMAGAQLQQQLAQTELTRQQSQMVPTPYGPMPAGMAKVVFPALIKGQTARDVASTNVQGRENVANINKRFMAVPGVGMFDTQSRQVIPGSQQGITVTPEIAGDYGLPTEFVGKPMSLTQLATLERGQAFSSVPVQGADGPGLAQRNPMLPNYGKVTPLGIGNPGVATAMARPVQVADPNNPGNVSYATAGTAIKTGAPSPQSGTSQAARAVTKSAVAGPIGNEINAFNVATQHADLLLSASRALDNGDWQTVNSLRNRFKNEFGVSGPITSQTIADAYAREVTRMLSANHMTDAEINTIGKTVNPQRQSPEQIEGVLGAYKALAASKMRMRQQQVMQGQKGLPNFPASPSPQTHVFSPTAWSQQNPNGDVNAATTAARQQGYQIGR